MSSAQQISTEFLRNTFEIVMQRFEEDYGETVSLEEDYFWSIPWDQIFDVSSKPRKLTIGQLSECIENLRENLDDPELAIAYSLVWIGDILRAIGMKPPPSSAS